MDVFWFQLINTVTQIIMMLVTNIKQLGLETVKLKVNPVGGSENYKKLHFLQ